MEELKNMILHSPKEKVFEFMNDEKNQEVNEIIVKAYELANLNQSESEDEYTDEIFYIDNHKNIII